MNINLAEKGRKKIKPQVNQMENFEYNNNKNKF